MKLKPGMFLRAKKLNTLPSYVGSKEIDDVVFLVGRSRFSQSNGPCWTLLRPDGLFVKYPAKIIQQYFMPLFISR